MVGFEENVVSVFARAAASYGQVGPDLFGHFGTRIVELLALTKGSSVLDVACGTGAVLAAATKAIGPDGRAVGIDLTEAMAVRARVAVHQSVAVMNAHALGFANETFDGIACNFALTYFTDPQRALAECCRVLRAQGRFGLAVHDGWWWHDDPRWAWHAHLLREFGNHRATAARRFSDPNAVLAVVEEAGFTNPTATVEPFDLTWSDASQWWDWCWTHGYRAVLEQFETTALDQFRTVCLSHLPDGPIYGTLPVICVVASRLA